MRTLHSIGGNIDLCTNLLTHRNGSEELKFDRTCSINNLIVDENIENEIKFKLDELIEKFQGIFINDKTKEFLAYNTNIKCSIATIIATPVWSKQYPIPFSSMEFVNKEVESLLGNKIIRRLFSMQKGFCHVYIDDIIIYSETIFSKKSNFWDT